MDQWAKQREALDALFSEVNQQVAEAEAGAVSGNIDLSGMDRKIRRLCDLAAELPPDVSDSYLSQLEALSQSLIQLSTHLKASRDSVQDELQALGGRKQAHRAYGASSALVPKAPDEPEDGGA